MDKKMIATIELDGGAGTGTVFAERVEGGYRIVVERPDGECEVHDEATQMTLQHVINDVQTLWGDPHWQLRWINE